MIIVSYESEILGSDIFWKGKEEDINQIRNIPAREAAKMTIRDGKTRTIGMWKIEKVA